MSRIHLNKSNKSNLRSGQSNFLSSFEILLPTVFTEAPKEHKLNTWLYIGKL